MHRTFQTLDRSVDFELLIWRDLPDVHHVCNQITGSERQSFAQRLSLGLVVIDLVCICKVYLSKEVNVNKKQILNDRRCTTFPVYINNINVKDDDGEPIPKNTIWQQGILLRTAS